jgi:NAD(P)-dependent dehydrogenase (short-subunit alcohol dehydrogenase family)/acyl carrier protein
VHAALAELTDAGADVCLVTGNVADPASMRAALEQVEDRFGPVNGVIHSAGLPGGGLLDRRTREETEQVFAAKVRGTLVLAECFADRPPLDFLLLFSSQASMTGLVGSGDYAAANGFQNAYAQQSGRSARWTTAVAWPGWSGVGMIATATDLDAIIGAVPAQVVQSQGRASTPPEGPDPLEYVVRYDKNQDWELDEHRYEGVPLLAGTSALALTLTAARSLGLFPSDAPLDLRDAVFLAPISGAEPIEVGVVFTPVAGTFRFRVQSRAAGSEGPWEYHVNGVVATSADEPRQIDPAALRARLRPAADDVPLDGHLQYGPRWRTVTGLWSGEGEHLVELTLPEPFHADLATHPTHPALVDRASIAVFHAAHQPKKQYLPFLYRQVTSFAPLPHQILVYGRPGREQDGVLVIDTDICHPATGSVLMAIRSYTVRETRPNDFARRLSAATPPGRGTPAASVDAGASSSAAQHVDRSAVGAVETSPVTAGGLALLTARDGAAAFRELLDGAFPPLVLVEPPGPPLKIPGMPRMPYGGLPALAHEPAVPVEAGATGKAVPDSPPDPSPLPDRAAGPVGDVFEVLRELWSEALGVDEISLDDDFFDLGGNSLVSVQLSARIRQRFGVDLSAAALFDANTIRRLADELSALGAG